MVTRKNDEAVSPVIGVILMVAITVILAAVIAAFVFGMSGNIQKTKVVAATVTQPDSFHIVITYQGGQDDQTLTGINVTAPNGTLFVYTPSVALTRLTLASSNPAIVKPSVGASMTLFTTTLTGVDSFVGQDHVVVTGSFGDGANQVMLDTYV